jgi:hypothetical protein
LRSSFPVGPNDPGGALEPLKDGGALLIGDTGVDHRASNVAVPKVILDNRYLFAGIQEMGGHRVP